ncbi:hypothetical protein ES702_00334 [subsurface metagenome]
MFQGLDIEVLIEIEKRLKAELKDPELPYQRRQEVNACLYHIKEAERVKKGFYSVKS